MYVEKKVTTNEWNEFYTWFHFKVFKFGSVFAMNMGVKHVLEVLSVFLLILNTFLGGDSAYCPSLFLLLLKSWISLLRRVNCNRASLDLDSKNLAVSSLLDLQKNCVCFVAAALGRASRGSIGWIFHASNCATDHYCGISHSANLYFLPIFSYFQPIFRHTAHWW